MQQSTPINRLSRKHAIYQAWHLAETLPLVEDYDAPVRVVISSHEGGFYWLVQGATSDRTHLWAVAHGIDIEAGAIPAIWLARFPHPFEIKTLGEPMRLTDATCRYTADWQPGQISRRAEDWGRAQTHFFVAREPEVAELNKKIDQFSQTDVPLLDALREAVSMGGRQAAWMFLADAVRYHRDHYLIATDITQEDTAAMNADLSVVMVRNLADALGLESLPYVDGYRFEETFGER